MDVKHANNDLEELTSLQALTFKRETLPSHGIFYNDSTLSCHVCNKPIQCSGISMHITGRNHFNKMYNVKSNCTQSGNLINCKLCEDFKAVDWGGIIKHFIEAQHFEFLENQKKAAAKKIPHISYNILCSNQIIEYECGIYFCCCCAIRMDGWEQVLLHISEEDHASLHVISEQKSNSESHKEGQCRKFVRNCIQHMSAETFYCYLCDTLLKGLATCVDHIIAIAHTLKVIDKIDTRDKFFLQNVKATPQPVSPCLKLSQNGLLESMQDNSIIGPLSDDKYSCKLCQCKLRGLVDVQQHVTCFEHRKQIYLRCTKTKSHTKSAKVSDDETSSNSSESSDSSSENSLTNRTYSESISNNSDTLSMGSLPLAYNNSKLFVISKRLLPLIAQHSLQHLETEIYCPACDVHLKYESSLINHTRSKRHTAAVQSQMPKNDSPTTSKNNITINSATNAIDKMPLLPSVKDKLNTSVQKCVVKPKDKKSKLRHIPQKLMPLISEHLLQRRKNEIFCFICEAHLRDLKSIKSHTSSQRHLESLNSFKKSQIESNQKHLPKTSQTNSPLNISTNMISGKKLPVSDPSYTINTPKTLITESKKIKTKLSNSLIRESDKTSLVKDGAKIANKYIDSNQTSTKNVGTDSSMIEVNKTSMNLKSKKNLPEIKTVTTKVEDSRSNMIILKEFSPWLAEQSLQRAEDSLYCEACQEHINDLSILLNHTSSPKHQMQIKLFKASSSDVDTLLNSVLEDTHEHEQVELVEKTQSSTVEENASSIVNVTRSISNLENSMKNLTTRKLRSKHTKVDNQNNIEQLTMLNNSVSLDDSKKMPQDSLKKSKNPQKNRNRESQEQIVNQRKNGIRGFDPKYLTTDMQHLYEIHPEKLRIIKLSCQLCFPKTLNLLYCLICEKSVSRELQTFYEHICSSIHTLSLTDTEKHNQHFIDHPDQFSELTLAKEFMLESSKESIQCFACDTTVDDNDVVILEHINKESHKERKHLWKEAMNKILQDMLEQMKSSWYNIHNYWCQPCDKKCNTEFSFAQHINKPKHLRCVNKMGAFRKKLFYDACIHCATLWIGFPGVYTQHCEQAMHKYMVRMGDYSRCELPKNVKKLLQNSESEVDELIRLSDLVVINEKEKVDALLRCLENTVNPRFPDAKAHPFGSRVSGLGFSNSDIDVYLDCGTYNGLNTSDDHQNEILISTEQCFRIKKQLWKVDEVVATSRTPIIKLYHRGTELSCDVSFKNGLSVENTQLIKCYIDNYPLCRKLMLFVKKWLTYCKLSGATYITSYAICWYVIYYLQTESILPSVASLIAQNKKSKIIDGWETGICKTFDVDVGERSFIKLLHGFFVFYSNFDFRNLVACPLVGYAILKLDFTDISLLPKEMETYKDRISKSGTIGPVELFRIDSEMCIQDPYDLSHNLTKAVRKFTLNCFRRLCAASADVLNNLIEN